MTKRVSYTKHENRLLPGFRDKLNVAESTEDVKKFFVYTVKSLLDLVYEGKFNVYYEDIVFDPDHSPPYSFGERLNGEEDFRSDRRDSDLPRVLDRLADAAIKRYRHLEKNPGKTTSKIRN